MGGGESASASEDILAWFPKIGDEDMLSHFS
jgi:hypothetical protein